MMLKKQDGIRFLTFVINNSLIFGIMCYPEICYKGFEIEKVIELLLHYVSSANTPDDILINAFDSLRNLTCDSEANVKILSTNSNIDVILLLIFTNL